ncbi:hypothetical protein [Pseudomonas xionganensis]|uniref:Uncharacterized protein n=1 Tax=Pseudomonas xionganensis TaxID=2654845 RepID=A0A6I4KRV3_9PSED|nr:hypothetical protein [Pseudomonas xionganensis]MVW74837.1 hypothetical protein [Pseudomonas xionganensis]
MELNKAVLDCMQALRRKLREEQAVDIRLSQTDAISAMLSACLASSNEETRQLGQRLAQLSDMPYQSAPSVPALVEAAHVAARSGSVRIYRGQRVYA